MSSTLSVPVHVPEKGAIPVPFAGGTSSGLLIGGRVPAVVSFFLQEIIMTVKNNMVNKSIVNIVFSWSRGFIVFYII
jgi:hypothetical protein